eukprot:c14754_g1_i1.p1 GENE.c14754_g1_i1~~c14754_g1_i1.p1  ORF type:complete len:334 (+),score=62.37 c14754_g1_i1:63-1064(+)
MSCSTTHGVFFVIGSVLSFGSFILFLKLPAVSKLQPDPVVFQAYKSFWAFATSFIVLFFHEFEYTPVGIVSGMFWVPAGTIAVIAVRSVGIAVGEGIWSGVIVVVNCVWGLLIFQEDVGNLPITLLGILLLLLGVVGMATTKVIAAALTTCREKPELPLVVGTTDRTLVKFTPRYTRRIGLFAAFFTGIWGGSIYVPLKIANRYGVKTSGYAYILSFGIGVAIVQVAVLLIYGVIRKFVFHDTFFPNFYFHTLWWAGSGAGLFWSVGNFFSLLSMLCLGQAVGYSACQASLLVSGLWGVFYFKEIRGVAVIIFFVFASLTVVGVCLMTLGRNG